MEKWINYFVANIAFLGNGAYWILFGVAILESTALVGLLVPGTTILVVAGFLASQGALNFKILFAVVAFGNIIGDTFSFYLGRRGTTWFKPGNKIFKMEYVERGQRFFKKHGDKSILLARFIGPLRPVIPFVAGLFRMQAPKFFLFNIIGGFLAALFYLSLGYFFGQATGQLHAIFGTAKWFFGSLVVIVILLFLFKRYLTKQGQEIVIAIRLVFEPAQAAFLEHHARLRKWLTKREQARFPLIFWFSVSLALIFAILIGSGIAEKWLTSSVVSTGDLSTVSWLYAERRGWLTVLFLIITGFGKSIVAALLVLLAALLVSKYKRKLYLVSLFISVGGAGGMVELIKHLVARPRPEFIAVYHETGFSFPSGHAMFSAVFGGWIIFLIWHEAKQWTTKVNVLFACVIMMLLVSFSRLYLGVHYPSDVLTGFSIGLIWLGIGTGVQRVCTHESKLKPPN